MNALVPDATAPPNASLAAAKAQLDVSRLLGRVSAWIFLLASIAVLDALQSLVRHEFNSIDLVPGETVQLSGMMPSGAASHTDLDVRIEASPASGLSPWKRSRASGWGGRCGAPKSRPISKWIPAHIS